MPRSNSLDHWDRESILSTRGKRFLVVWCRVEAHQQVGLSRRDLEGVRDGRAMVFRIKQGQYQQLKLRPGKSGKFNWCWVYDRDETTAEKTMR